MQGPYKSYPTVRVRPYAPIQRVGSYNARPQAYTPKCSLVIHKAYKPYATKYRPRVLQKQTASQLQKGQRDALKGIRLYVKIVDLFSRMKRRVYRVMISLGLKSWKWK